MGVLGTKFSSAQHLKSGTASEHSCSSRKIPSPRDCCYPSSLDPEAIDDLALPIKKIHVVWVDFLFSPASAWLMQAGHGSLLGLVGIRAGDSVLRVLTTH